ncbi:hypothetical protein AYO39_03480 [Actinobacteria bacterium SCGC AG-212-D09]|nr:hypothetical protein AYO39_03480 [Actinobacteria bacterium SCGC AG-212-D09]
MIVSQNGAVLEAGAGVVGKFQTGETLRIDDPPDGETIDRMHQRAQAWVVGYRDGQELELQERADETITAQIESLRLSADRRRLALQQQIEESRSERIVRMRAAQLRRLESEFEAKVDRLEQRRGVSVGYRLTAAGLVAPIANAATAPAAAAPRG